MSKVEWKRLGDVCDITTGNCNKEDAVENGRFPFFVRSKEVFRINRYLFDEEAVIIPGEGGIGDIFHYVKGKYGLHQRAYRIHPKVNDIYCKFIYYYLVTNFKQYICQKSVSATVTSIRKPMLEAFCFPKPLPKVQQQIVEQLDTFTTLIAKLESELTLRQKQYEFYREELLNFDGDEEVEWKKLGEICDIGTGNNNREDAITDGLYPFFVRSKEVFRINKYLFDEEAVIIPGEGGIGDIFHYVSGKYGLHQRAYRIHPKACIYNCKYIYYYLAANFKQYIVQKSVSATVTSIRKPMLEDFCICIPSPELQQYIVDKLDTFTTLISKLESEITLRRKQYEFYREKLLTFE